MIKQAMSSLLQSFDLDCVEVVSYEEETKYDGYCETCYYEWTEVVIEYKDSNGDTQSYNYWGGFAELVRALDRHTA